MLTTAGAARATESAKLCMTTAGRGVPAAGIGAIRIAAGDADAPRRAGLHQTTKKAMARPTTAALSKKLARTRAFCNPTPLRCAKMAAYLCIMRPQYLYGKHYGPRRFREIL